MAYIPYKPYNHYQDHADLLFGSTLGHRHRTLRTLFDNMSAEWKQTTMDEKEAIFDKLISSGRPLVSWLDGYINFYTNEIPNKSHVLLDLPNTLLSLLEAFDSKYRSKIEESINCLKFSKGKPFLQAHSIFKTREEIIAYFEKGLEDGYEGVKTRDLVGRFNELKEKRKPFYLSAADMDDIFTWKLRTQKPRTQKHRESNTPEKIEEITKAAFALRDEDNERETENRLKILTNLGGARIPVASAILTLTFPDKYAVIDFRNWRQVFEDRTDKGPGNKKSNFSTKEYTKYLQAVKQVAERFEVTPQHIDIALWKMDMDK